MKLNASRLARRLESSHRRSRPCGRRGLFSLHAHAGIVKQPPVVVQHLDGDSQFHCHHPRITVVDLLGHAVIHRTDQRQRRLPTATALASDSVLAAASGVWCLAWMSSWHNVQRRWRWLSRSWRNMVWLVSCHAPHNPSGNGCSTIWMRSFSAQFRNESTSFAPKTFVCRMLSMFMLTVCDDLPRRRSDRVGHAILSQRFATIDIWMV